ncbi:tRNA (adenosine(37)-N6)-dimethylallyltransferase MiaA [Salinisphaera sp. T31B1]|uniref:tRNA (adenosine(37)-N6)-dimethylallyltransferase MiaA n=1 Tax=Salinisphaera sp. T31B1 TaxID=727963 RepID=UPI003340B7A7
MSPRLSNHETPRAEIIFVLGPTASGKTGLAVDLVERLNAEIVSVDSAMVYRGMDIGTAKPDAPTLARAPHALIDIRDPGEPYSAAAFRDDALDEIRRIRAAGRVPLLTGGTSLYFRALEHGLSALPARDDAIRARLTNEAQTIGWAGLHARLAELDPASAQRIHPNDAQRIQRALEIHALTGHTPTALYQAENRRENESRLPWSICKLVVAPRERAVLHERIERRFRRMMEQGLLNEVEKLYARPDLTPELPAVRAVGYRQLWQVMSGELSIAQGVERSIHASRQLAKRQLTWLRSLDDACWFDSDEGALTERAVAHLQQRVAWP